MVDYMEYKEFIKELKLEEKVLSVILTSEEKESYEIPKSFCIMKDFDKLKNGNTLIINKNNLKCMGGICGSGFNDGLPDIKGGFGYFISYGKESNENERYPPGERIKKNPEIGEEMFHKQPKDVLDGNKYILVKHYEESDNPRTVTMKATPDQLSAITFLFNFEKSEYDNIYLGISAGCASVFRMPFHEAKTKSGKGVIGNLDFVGRFKISKDPENTVYFSVSGEEFKKMLKNADESLLITSPWKAFRKRITS
jgi:hypothetical protein